MSARQLSAAVSALAGTAVLAFWPALAHGAPVLPWLKVTSSALPSTLAPGGEGNSISVAASNLGTATLQASPSRPVKIVEELPAGWAAGHASAVKWPRVNTVGESPCTAGGRTVSCTFTEPLAPYERWEVAAAVTVPSGAGDAVDVVRIYEGAEGAEVLAQEVRRPLHVGATSTPFGVESYEVSPETETGGVETQAGAHPFQLTTQLSLNAVSSLFNGSLKPTSPQAVKDLRIALPPGLIGNTRAVAQCSEAQFATILTNGVTNECPASTDVGAAFVLVDVVNFQGPESVAVPVVNLVPARGEPARFGFTADGVPVTLDTSVQGGDFHVTVNVANASLAYPVLNSVVTIWGNPGDVRHDPSRGVSCLARGWLLNGTGEPSGCRGLGAGERPTEAFLTMPTWCSGQPLSSSVEALAWGPGAVYQPPVQAAWPSPLDHEGLQGCEKLAFAPALSVAPTEHTASTPTGMTVKLTVPQEGTLSEDGLATADLRNTTVVLPQQLQLSPSAANGLQACSERAVGYENVNPQSGTLEFAPEQAREETAAEEGAREAAGTLCPSASKIGAVRIKTPILEDELRGSVYLAAQEANPFGSLFALYIVVKDPATGIVVKLAGKVQLDGGTGQITTTFANAPQDPFQEFELTLFNGPRASLATPRDCGTYTTEASLQSWAGGPAALGADEGLQFGIEAGPGGAPCLASWPFAPVVHAGSTNSTAGALTSFALTLTRPEGDQALKTLALTLPPGMAGFLKNVVQCPEPQASEGTCGPESLIGQASAVSGLGPDPYTIGGGRVYITGPYESPQTHHRSPFGLSIVIPAAAGPFNFGNVVTRSSIDVDPATAQLTVTSELPSMVDTVQPGGGTRRIGVPVQLRRVDVLIDRPEFQFNPTNCSPLAITGSVSGEQGAVSQITQPFQVTGCRALPFAPRLSVETDAKWNRVDGTNLRVVVEGRTGDANIQSTKLVFPLQLPSRLTTLQKACLQSVFLANPARCPEGAAIGTAVAHTPVLENPLAGPVYLVARGDEFPDVEIVLQGEGVTLVLDGHTNIHNGITSSTFNTVPDAPVEKFEVNLPAGPDSAFTGYGNLCRPTRTVTGTVITLKRLGRGGRRVRVRRRVSQQLPTPLVVPATLGAQNGDVLEETLPLRASGCGEVHASKTKKAPRRKRPGARRKPGR